MNKFGFVSSLITLIIFFLEFIPLGLYIGASGATSSWLLNVFGVSTNPWMRAYAQFPLEFFNDGNVRLFIWGIISNGNLSLWHEVHLLSFLVLFLLSIIKGFITFIGSLKENKAGKNLMVFNLIALLIIITYIVIGTPFFSLEIIGTSLDILGFIDYLEIAFLLLLLDLLFSYYALNHHPIKEE
jgi:hypothetical protein